MSKNGPMIPNEIDAFEFLLYINAILDLQISPACKRARANGGLLPSPLIRIAAGSMGSSPDSVSTSSPHVARGFGLIPDLAHGDQRHGQILVDEIALRFGLSRCPTRLFP
jgi:hypothetical protein